MKKLAVFLCTTLLVLSVVRIGKAVPMYYAFEGTVRAGAAKDPIGILASQGIAGGNAVTYVLMIDLDEVGTRTDNKGVTAPFSLPDNFYVDYVGGSAVEDSGFITNNFLELNFGFETTTRIDLYANSYNNQLQLWTTSTPFSISTWTEGVTDFDAYNRCIL